MGSAGNVAADSFVGCGAFVVLGLCQHSDGGTAISEMQGVSEEVCDFSYSDGSLCEELRRGCVGDLQWVQEVQDSGSAQWSNSVGMG